MIAAAFNPLVPFLCQRMYLGIFQIFCFLKDCSPTIERLAIHLLDASGAVTKLTDVFIKFMNKESFLYISNLEYISDACSETDIRVETIHSELSRYGNIKASRC